MNFQQTIDLAHQAYNSDDLSGSASLCRKVLEQQPDHPQMLHLMGLIAHRVGNYESAAELISKVVTLTPEDASAHCNLGNAQKNLKRLDEAIVSYHKAIARDPEYVEAHTNLGMALQGQKKFGDAAARYRTAIFHKPDHAAAYNNLGACLLSLEKDDEAVASYRKAIEIKPDYAAAHANLGTVLMQQDAFDQAIVCFRTALRHNPKQPQALNNLGGCLKSMNRPDEALDSYRKSISLMPNNAIFHWNLSFLLLQMGAYREGWQEYDWGLKIDGKRAPALPVPRWQGEPLDGKTILIYAEQGVGDEIMFSACIPDLVEKSPAQIFLECDPRLQDVFKRSFHGVNVFGKSRDIDLSWVGPNTVLDYCLPIGSLPLYFRKHQDDFLDRKAFLIASPVIMDKWAERFEPLGDRPKIGISWRGGNRQVAHKSSTPLASWKSLLSADVSVINLQYGDVADEISAFSKETGIPIYDWPDNDPLLDLDHQAALIAHLDLVISIDNATVHSAGALGVPVWNLMDSTVNSMWMENQTDRTPLYPEMRLFKKYGYNDWADVLERVETELRTYLAG